MTPMVGASVARKEDSRLLTGRGRFVQDIAAAADGVHGVRPQYGAACEDHRHRRAGPRASIRACSACGPRRTSATSRRLPSLEVPGVPARPPLASATSSTSRASPSRSWSARRPRSGRRRGRRRRRRVRAAARGRDLDAALAERRARDLRRASAATSCWTTCRRTTTEALAAAPRRASCACSTSAARRSRSSPSPAWPTGTPRSSRCTRPARCRTRSRTAWPRPSGSPQHQVRVVAPGCRRQLRARRAPAIRSTSSHRSCPVSWAGRSAASRRAARISSATTHGRAQVHDVEVGFDDDGQILALQARRHAGLRRLARPRDGLHPRADHDDGQPAATGFRRWTAGFRVVATNTTPIASYRGAGRPEASYTIERVIDLVAPETGADPVEVRRRNFIPADAFPYQPPTGLYLDSGDYEAGLDLLTRPPRLPRPAGRTGRRPGRPVRPLMGIGFATYVELGGVGPSAYMRVDVLGGWESARVRMQPDGSVVVAHRHVAAGPGARDDVRPARRGTSSAYRTEAVTVVHGDTDTVQEGIGTFGSRLRRGRRVGRRTRPPPRLGERLRRVAAHLLEADPGDIDLPEGRLSVRGSPERTRSRWPSRGHGRVPAPRPAIRPPARPGGGPRASNRRTTPSPSARTAASSAWTARPGVRVERYLAVDDCGTVVNPMLADGQIMGGVAQGIAQALLEEVRHDEAGRPRPPPWPITWCRGRRPARYELDRTVTPTPVNSAGRQGDRRSPARRARRPRSSTRSSTPWRRALPRAGRSATWTCPSPPRRCGPRCEEVPRDPHRVSITVNGERQTAEVEPRTLLVHLIRDTGRTGTHVGCDTSDVRRVHGAGGRRAGQVLHGVRGCRPTGTRSRPFEGVAGAAGAARSGGLSRTGGPRPQAWAAVRLLHSRHGRCRRRRCSPRIPIPPEERIREGLKGNLCRCTGYQSIVEAVRWAASHVPPNGGDRP